LFGISALPQPYFENTFAFEINRVQSLQDVRFMAIPERIIPAKERFVIGPQAFYLALPTRMGVPKRSNLLLGQLVHTAL
jgi:hypothetical protein